MKRRESLRWLLAVPVAGMASGTAGTPWELEVAIYDGRFPAARALAARSYRAYDCRADAALLWYASFSTPRSRRRIRGLTTPADAMVLADCAERCGLRLTRGRPRRDGLVGWVIAGTDLS